MTNQVVTQTPSVAPNNSAGIVNYSSGGFSTDAGTAVAFSLSIGFKPRKFRLINLTGGGNGPIEYEWLDQMAAANSLTKTPGATNTFTVAQNTSSLITVTDGGVTLAAGVMAASSAFVWEAFA